jgi:hypothetical protein
MAEDAVSRRQEHARIPRDHLPQPVHPGAGRAEKRADRASADQALYAPLTTCNGQRTVAGSNRRRPLDPRKSCGSGRSSGSRALGRRSAERGKEHLHRDFPRGTDLAPISQAQLDQVALRLNRRPRKTLGFQTPASKLQASVASTV